jgi:hypothetical protein
MSKAATITEAAILEKVIGPTTADLTPEAARALLSLKFDRQTTQLIRGLLRNNNKGAISAAERMVLEKYIRVGQFLDLLHGKAQLSLKENGHRA